MLCGNSRYPSHQCLCSVRSKGDIRGKSSVFPSYPRAILTVKANSARLVPHVNDRVCKTGVISHDRIQARGGEDSTQVQLVLSPPFERTPARQGHGVRVCCKSCRILYSDVKYARETAITASPMEPHAQASIIHQPNDAIVVLFCVELCNSCAPVSLLTHEIPLFVMKSLLIRSCFLRCPAMSPLARLDRALRNSGSCEKAGTAFP